MGDFLLVLLASGLVAGLLYLPYQLVFRKLTHFTWNRWYLLAIPFLALALTFAIPQAVESFNAERQFWVPAMDWAWPAGGELASADAPEATELAEGADSGRAAGDGAESTAWSTPALLGMLLTGLVAMYGLGLAFFGLRFAGGLFKVGRWFLRHPKRKSSGALVLTPPEIPATFSFFRAIFLAPQDVHSPDRASIEAHERAHIDQLHTVDVLLGELAACIWWFLPWFRWWHQSIKDNHEFLADRAVAARFGPTAYSRTLLSHSLRRSAHLPVHFFAQSKTQQRILMLNRISSSRTSIFKYLAVLPMLGLSALILACMPLGVGDEPEITDVTIAMTLDFAGEPVPLNPMIRVALEDQRAQLVEKPATCQKLYLRAQRFRREVGSLLAAKNIPDDFIYLMMAESHFDPEATSSWGAKGPWQFMPATAREYGMEVSDNQDDRVDLTKSTDAAAKYLQRYQGEFGSWTVAALAFNRGPAALRKVAEGADLNTWYQLDHERGYLYNILTMKSLVEHPELFGLKVAPALISPLKGKNLKITSRFGMRHSPFAKETKHHDGIDLRADEGTLVMAVADGKVEVAKMQDTGVGNHIQLNHESPLSSHYNHLKEIRVKPGQMVKQGDVIGTVGSSGLSTGPHLHLEIRENNKPVNPELYIRF